MRYDWYLPLDPECPDNPVPAFLDDPMTQYYGMGSEMAPDLEDRHRAECATCQAFGVENIDVVEAS